MGISSMVIYPLPPKELDDKTLSQQVKAIAQVLCNAHHRMLRKVDNIPLPPKNIEKCNYSLWVNQCLANYKKLVEVGLACCEEYTFRFSERGQDNKWKDAGWIDFSIPYYKEIKQPKLQPVIEWARDNVPDLPHYYAPNKGKICCGTNWEYNLCGHTIEETPFPLVMPEEYIKYECYEHKTCINSKTIDIIESCRNYYRAKLQKIIDKGCPCDNCLCMGATKCLMPTWTRREKPSWLAEKA
jgi:hypothetical protein